MADANPVVRNAAYCLAHVPEWVRFGSKPRREIRRNPGVGEALESALRSFASCVSYPPNQVFVGGLTPAGLAGLARPWFETPAASPEAIAGLRQNSFGEIVDSAFFTALLCRADRLQPPLVELTQALSTWRNGLRAIATSEGKDCSPGAATKLSCGPAWRAD